MDSRLFFAGAKLITEPYTTSARAAEAQHLPGGETLLALHTWIRLFEGKFDFDQVIEQACVDDLCENFGIGKNYVVPLLKHGTVKLHMLRIALTIVEGQLHAPRMTNLNVISSEDTRVATVLLKEVIDMMGGPAADYLPLIVNYPLSIHEAGYSLSKAGWLLEHGFGERALTEKENSVYECLLDRLLPQSTKSVPRDITPTKHALRLLLTGKIRLSETKLFEKVASLLEARTKVTQRSLERIVKQILKAYEVTPDLEAIELAFKLQQQ